MTETYSDNVDNQLDHVSRMNKDAAENLEYWKKIMHTRYPIYMKFLKKFMPYGKLLDIGSGFAQIWFDEYVKPNGYEYYCTDLSNEVIDFMSDKIRSQGNKIYAKQGTLENLPWDDNMFNIVFVSHILEHSPDIAKAFCEIKRVLKSEGVLLFAVPCGYDDEPAHIHNREYEEWLDDFKNNKMEILESGRFDFNLNEFYGIVRFIE